MSTDLAFEQTLAKIRSVQHVALRAAAGAWTALATAAGAESGALSAAASQAAGEKGVGLLELADRLQATRSWADGARGVAQQIADQLHSAAGRSAKANERAAMLREEYAEIVARQTSQNFNMPDGPGHIQANRIAEEDKQRKVEEARQELEELGAEFARVIGGTAPPAPEGGVGSGTVPAAGGGGGVGAGVGAVAGAMAAQVADYEAPNGSLIGSGEYPYASVLGPEHGDFAGWVLSPSTGYLVDPATGREFDPSAGRWIDPVTGQPFGAVTEYASRLSGLGAGPGAVASAGGLATGPAVGGGGAALGAAGLVGGTGLAGLYGGVVPPSVGHSGPARQQVIRQAVANLDRRARVASRFAAHEAAQGGRPFRPPPTSGYPGARGPAGRPGVAPRTPAGPRNPAVPRSPAAPRTPYVPRTPAGPAAPTGRAPVAAGAGRAVAPPATGGTGARPPATGAGRPAGAAGGGAGRTGARTAITEPARTWRARAQDATARHQLTARPRPGAATPGPTAGTAQNRTRDEAQRRTGRRTELTEDPEVWAPREAATRGVLGEAGSAADRTRGERSQ